MLPLLSLLILRVPMYSLFIRSVLVLCQHRLHLESIQKYGSSVHPCFALQCSKQRQAEFSKSCRKLFHLKFHLILADSFLGEPSYIALNNNELSDCMKSLQGGKRTYCSFILLPWFLTFLTGAYGFYLQSHSINLANVFIS